MMQLEVPFRVIRDHYPYVNLVFGTNNIDQLFPLMDDCLRNSKRVLKVVSDPGRVVEGFPSARMESTVLLSISHMDATSSALIVLFLSLEVCNVLEEIRMF